MSELDERLKKLDEDDLRSRWQTHRMFCLKLAVKLGAASPEQAIEIAEKLGSLYILRPPGPVEPPSTS
jgi:hypothetical protein